MKNILKLCLFISFHSMYPSVLHQAIRHIPKSEAASHATRETSHRNLYDYAMRYQIYILTGKGDPELFNLITKETLENGFKPFNLLAKDVRRILELLKISLFQGEDIIDSPLSTLPDFIMKDYVNIVYDVADNWEKYDKEYYSKEGKENLSHLLGENKNIRHGISDLIYKNKNLKYSYIPKTYKKMEQEIKKTMAKFLHFFYNYELIEDIQSGAIGEKTEGIIVAASDRFNYDQILKDIFNKKPNLKLVVIFNDTLKSTPHFFQINNFVKNLVICGSSITDIEDNFLYSSMDLKELDLSPLTRIKSIKNRFLNDSSELQKLVLSPLLNVTSIGSHFLASCSSLKELDLSLLSNVTSIGKSFLAFCSSLQQLDLSPLSNVKSIGDNFLLHCLGLQQLDLSPLSNVTSIGVSFLSDCQRLKELDLYSLSDVINIGDYFLFRCAHLQELDLSPLSKVTSIGNYFLTHCSGLKELDLRSLSKVTNIGDYFLANCSELKELDLRPLSKVTNIGDKFLLNCSGLKKIIIDKEQTYVHSKLTNIDLKIIKIID